VKIRNKLTGISGNVRNATITTVSLTSGGSISSSVKSIRNRGELVPICFLLGERRQRRSRGRFGMNSGWMITNASNHMCLKNREGENEHD
jgi:hypothetical protein